MSHFNTIAVLLLLVAVPGHMLWDHVRFRRIHRRMAAREEAERISSLPLGQFPDQPSEKPRRSRLRLVPAIAGLVGLVAWLRARPYVSAASLAAASTAFVTVVMVPSMSRDITADRPSVAVPLSSSYMRPTTAPAPTPFPAASTTASVTHPSVATSAAPSSIAPHTTKLVLPSLPSLPTVTLPTTLVALPTTTQPVPSRPEPKHPEPKLGVDASCPLVDLHLLMTDLCRR